MSGDEVKVLSHLRPKSWTMTAGAAWSDTVPTHVPQINLRATQEIVDGIEAAEQNPDASALGLAVTGPKGSGKTHQLACARPEVQNRGGYYFLAEFTDGRGFWHNLAHTLLDGLRQPHTQDDTQLLSLLKRLAYLADVDNEVIDVLLEKRQPTKIALNHFVGSLWRADRRLKPTTRSTLRSLVLLAANDMDLEAIGDAYLRSASEMTAGERAAWEIHTEIRPPRELVDEITWLLSLTGPSLLAVDQIDTLFGEHALVYQSGEQDRDRKAGLRLLEEFGQGFMDLYQTASRTFTVIACLPETWSDLRDRVIATAADRFRGEIRLRTIPSPAAAAAMIEAYFKPGFDAAGYAPPYPTWPIKPSCFEQATHFSPRALLKVVGQHLDRCRDCGVVAELESFDEAPVIAETVPTDEHTAEIEARYRELLPQMDIIKIFGEVDEDFRLPALLEAILAAGAIEAGLEDLEFHPPLSRNPDAHLRVHLENDAGTDQRTWSFRAIAKTHYLAVKSRVDRFAETCGIGLPGNRAFLLRTAAWQAGPKTKASIDEFRHRGGKVIDLGVDEMRNLAAVEVLFAEQPLGLDQWLRQHRPVVTTALGHTVFGDAKQASEIPTEAEPYQAPLGTKEVSAPPIVLGRDFATKQPVGVELEQLTRHLSIFAGSGSGKTVLLRRVVESCALHGISSIVIDSNNDLARLGVPWPTAPETFNAEDVQDAERYLAETDVVVWTPGRTAGRPLKFAPLPDFDAVRGDPDDFRATLDAAVETLAPWAKVNRTSAKDEQSRAVLREALIYLANSRSRDLPALLDVLANLPPEATSLTRGQEFGANMSQTLRAALINDQLLGESGTELDPSVLLTPDNGKRARVSVVNLSGLATEQQRTGFVNQLQMALFTWITKHPSTGLGALFVMDEAQNFVPTGMKTACARSASALAAQARKYGLGMVFATQAPKGIDNRIVGNTATQLYGRLTSPAQVNAAKELARQRGGALMDIARLHSGEFYLAAEGERFRKVRTPFCLSHHPSNALSPNEVTALAAASVPRR